jgi:signal transduction histidine kinase
LCADSLKQNCVNLSLELKGNLPLINIDHIQIERVILNLISNAIYAILVLPEKRQEHIAIQSRLNSSNEIEVRIKDNGLGIQRSKAKLTVDQWQNLTTTIAQDTDVH